MLPANSIFRKAAPAKGLLSSAVFYSFIILTVLLSTFGNTAAQESARSSVNVTVYNADLGVIRDTRRLNIKQGESEIAITDVAQLIDPTTVHINFDGEVLEQNYQYDLVNLEKILQKYTDQEVQLIGEKEEVLTGKLLSSYGGQIVLQKSDGGLIMLTGLEKYRISVNKLPEGLITRPTLLWRVISNTSRAQDVEISYQTRGLNWHTEYVAVLNENDTRLDLKAWVSIENHCGMSFNDASLKLVAGDLNLLPRAAEGYGADQIMMKQETMARRPQFAEQEFFEYHMYNLERKVSLANNETKQISLFEASNVPAVKKYLYRSGARYSYRGGQTGPKVSVVMEFDNKQSNNLGMPMPKGVARVYKSDGKSVEFIGEDQIEHTPREEKIKLKIGDAFDIVAEETQTDSKRISDRVHEESYEIKLRNRKKENITVEVERYLGLNWEVLDSSIEYKKKDAQNITFSVPVKSNEETTLKFRVRYSY